MKRLILVIILIWSTTYVATAQLKSEVSECFELTSIVFRLADVQEYVNNQLPAYTKDIDNYFAKYKDHKLISFIKEIRNKHAIGYDAVSTATTFLEIKNGKVQIKSDVGKFQISQKDNRWAEQDFKTFVGLLNDFYRKTKFRKFYTDHLDLYRIAEKRLDEVLKDFNIDWFRSLFREEVQNPIVMVSLCNGPNNYALSIPGEKERNGMVIGSGSDDKGLPYYHKNMIFIITHEFLHYYTNPLISNFWSHIEPDAQIIFPHVKEKMDKLAYGSAKTTMLEWFVNLLSIMYVRDNPTGSLSIDYLISGHQNRGFIWMERSVAFMNYFLNNRGVFKTIDDYMPQIVGLINYTAANFEQILHEFNNRHPYVVEVFPAPGSTIKPDIDTITIRFSEPMHGAQGMLPLNDQNILPIPRAAIPKWGDEDKFTLLIPVDKSKFENGKTYGFKLNKKFFQSAKTYPIKEDYTFTFNVLE
ncbi:MAG: DUF4932 domain-containing protein [Prevotella sp.]|jgi:hypothetical protein|nr:DUF4932 domain-containing protein [Prevotella sp.]